MHWLVAIYTHLYILADAEWFLQPFFDICVFIYNKNVIFNELFYLPEVFTVFLRIHGIRSVFINKLTTYFIYLYYNM